MSGEGSNKMENAEGSRESSIRVKLSLDRPVESSNSSLVDCGKMLGREVSPSSLKAPDARGDDLMVQGNKLPPKVRYKKSKTVILDKAEFNRNIASWFGEKGFTAMRSFFRASVLNSFQNEVTNNQSRCSDLDAVMVILIADHLLKNTQYFTMSVFTNEVLRPLSGCSAAVNNLLHRLGKSQGEIIDPVLTKDEVSFVLRSLDLNPHSLLGAEILHRYFEGSQNLMGIFIGLLKDNMRHLSVPDRAVRDNDIIAAFADGLNEEIDKFHYWFSDFNDQFVDVSVKLKKMISMRDCSEGNGAGELKKENALWERVKTIDDNLRGQQEALVKIRDKERRKLVLYAKELEALHGEMNAKLKSIQSYEHFLKQKERQMREKVRLNRNLILEKRGRGDYLSTGGSTENECDYVKYSSLYEQQPSRRHWNVPNTREASTQKFGTANEISPKEYRGNVSSYSSIMDENLELKNVLREQHLRIDALTRRVAALTASHSIDRESHTEQNNVLRQFQVVQKTEHPLPKHYSNRTNVRRPSNVSSLQTAVRRAKIEVCSLKSEKDMVDMQYERLLNNKLSKK